MNNKLFLELIKLKATTKIDEAIFRRILKLSHKNKGQELEPIMAHVLRSIHFAYIRICI